MVNKYFQNTFFRPCNSMSFKFIVTCQIPPEYDISTHQIQNFSGEGTQPLPRWGGGHPLPKPNPLRRLVRPPPLKIPGSATDRAAHPLVAMFAQSYCHHLQLLYLVNGCFRLLVTYLIRSVHRSVPAT